MDDDNSVVYSYNNIMIMIMIKNKFDTRTNTKRKNVISNIVIHHSLDIHKQRCHLKWVKCNLCGKDRTVPTYHTVRRGATPINYFALHRDSEHFTCADGSFNFNDDSLIGRLQTSQINL